MHVMWRALMSVALIAAGLLPALTLGGAAQAATLEPQEVNAVAAQPASEVIRGFTVSDAAGIPFYQTYQQMGLDVVGYPISQRFTWDGFTVQAFQKVIMQWQPGTNQVYFLNIIDIMGDRGHDGWLQVVRATPPRLPESFDAGARNFDEITEWRLLLLEQLPAFKQVYEAAPAPILQYGLPTSSVEDNGSHYVMRFQRIIMQQWKERVPWAEPGQVTIANGGDIAKEIGLLPEAALIPDNGSAGGGTTGGTLPTLPPLPPAGSPTLPPAGPDGPMAYGMQVDPGTDLNRALGLVRNAGFGWVKVQLRWENLEGSPGAINWDYIDGVINAIVGQGLKPQLSIVTAPQWARPGLPGTHGAPVNYQDYANFVGAISNRHQGKIGAIEVWNEQNLGREWGEGKVNAGDYVRFICTAYPAIKAADPNIIVISGAPTPTGVNEPGNVVEDLLFVEQMYQAGLSNCMDALGAHPQGFGNAADDDPNRNSKGVQQFIGHWSFYFRRFEQYRDVMVKYGDSAKKMWFTEFGSASSPNPHPTHAYAALNTEQDQAEYLVRAFQIGREKGYVGGMILWNLNFAPSADPGDSEAKLAYGIIRSDWSPRPAYNAVAAMPK